MTLNTEPTRTAVGIFWVDNITFTTGTLVAPPGVGTDLLARRVRTAALVDICGISSRRIELGSILELGVYFHLQTFNLHGN